MGANDETPTCCAACGWELWKGPHTCPPGTSRLSKKGVWVVEHGEYEMRAVWGVYSSPQVANDSIKSVYKDPYIVEWSDLMLLGDSEATLIGMFTTVPGYSVAHTSTWHMTRYEIDKKE